MLKQIERLRAELNELFATEGLTPRTLELSQKLDKLIVIEQKSILEEIALETIV